MAKKAKNNKIIAKNVLHAAAWPVWSDSQTNNSYELLLFSESKQTAYLEQSDFLKKKEKDSFEWVFQMNHSTQLFILFHRSLKLKCHFIIILLEFDTNRIKSFYQIKSRKSVLIL